MPIRRSPNGAHHPRPQPGRDHPEQVVAINRNAEGSNRSRGLRGGRGLRRDLFEAGLNEAAVSCAALWAFKPSADVFLDRAVFCDRSESARRRGKCNCAIKDGQSAGAICVVAQWF